MKHLQQLMNPIRSLFESWHSVDRIRISPSEGRLLRLAVGDTFVLFDSLYTVEQRRVETCDEGYNVVYTLADSAGDIAQLSVDTTAGQTSAGKLVSGSSDLFVYESDVTPVHKDCDRGLNELQSGPK